MPLSNFNEELKFKSDLEIYLKQEPIDYKQA